MSDCDDIAAGRAASSNELRQRLPSASPALVRNPNTPVAPALRITERLGLGDLKRLTNDDKVPTIGRVSASRILKRKTRDASRDHRASIG